MEILAQIDWEKSTHLRINNTPLIPTIVVDNITNKLLGLVYSSQESLHQAITTRTGIYYSRSRQALWPKSSSGRNSQRLEKIAYDCDKDALVFYVFQRGEFCHQPGHRSCFSHPITISPPATLRLGYCTGRMEQPTLRLLDLLQIQVYKNAQPRSMQEQIISAQFDVTLLPVKPRDMETSLQNHTVEVMFAYPDRFIPATRNNYITWDVPTDKIRKIKLALIASQKMNDMQNADQKQILVASEYPHYDEKVKEILAPTVPNVYIFHVNGGAETLVAHGIAEYALVIVDTGETLRANNLRIAHVIEEFAFGIHFTPQVYKKNPRFFRTLRNILTDDTIYFYTVDGPHGYMSNFYMASFTDKNNIVWLSSEHYYQAHKFLNPMRQEEVRQQPTPKECYKLAWRHQEEFRPDWLQVKDHIMREALAMKFTQNPQLLQALKATHPKRLVEHSLTDYHYGCGLDGTGKNMLGHLLMELRTAHIAKL